MARKTKPTEKPKYGKDGVLIKDTIRITLKAK